jgi:hypothetical protein
MSPKRGKSARQPRGAQKWILEELRDVSAGRTLSTAKLAKRIAKSSAKEFHKNSVYNALRALVRSGHITAVRVGQEKSYRLASPKGPGPGNLRVPQAAKPRVPAPNPNVPPSMLPHKLGLGEVLVIGLGDGYVLSATNLHGRLVIERHPLPG